MVEGVPEWERRLDELSRKVWRAEAEIAKKNVKIDDVVGAYISNYYTALRFAEDCNISMVYLFEGAGEAGAALRGELEKAIADGRITLDDRFKLESALKEFTSEATETARRILREKCDCRLR